jgi:hypothetical protein
MNEYMSMTRSRRRRSTPPRPLPGRPEVYATILGQYIQFARMQDGRPLEQIAPLAALTVPEWEAIEAGQVPDTWEQMCLIGAALRIGHKLMSKLVTIYVGASGPR